MLKRFFSLFISDIFLYIFLRKYLQSFDKFIFHAEIIYS